MEPNGCNINPELIEAAITPHTSAVLPVHVYGYSCNTAHIEKLADTYGLKVIYDAAHAFGVEDEGGTILRHGDLSILSFHATKVFTTFEGGAIICPDAKTKRRVDYLKNFGFSDEVTIVAPGINGKMNEFQSALGLVQLGHFDAALDRREVLDHRYREWLNAVPGIRCLPLPPSRRHNFAYFPILVGPEYPLTRDQLYARLREHGIFARRYFYPLISEFPMYRTLSSADPAMLPNARAVSAQVICLPLYPELEETVVRRIAGLILDLKD